VTLTEFLLVRIDDDEERARRAGILPGVAWEYEPDPTPAPLLLVAPARVLAECDARRQIVQLHEGATAYDGVDYCTVCSNVDRTGLDTDLEPMPCETLRLLAVPYADHPDWRPEWKPWPRR
jgi:hypothetical protein